MLTPEQKTRLAIFQNIRRNVYGKNWPCMVENCKNNSINSHLLQRNGILHNLVERGHLIQLKPTDIFKFEEDGAASFKRVGIEQVISYPLFCNEHDTAIFKPIEIEGCDFSQPQAQLLFSYRALCAELRKKDRDIEVHRRLLAANTLQHLEGFLEDTRRRSRKIEEGINELRFFKKAFELELADQAGRFVFFTGTYPVVKLCVSAICSYTKGINPRYWPMDRPLPSVFVNVFPKNDLLYVIMGYHVDCSTEGVLQYVKQWKDKQGQDATALLSDLVARVETWTMASSLYNSIPEEDEKKYLNYFVDSMDISSNLKSFDVNLFRQG